MVRYTDTPAEAPLATWQEVAGTLKKKVTGRRLDEGSSYHHLSSSFFNQSDQQHSYLNKWAVTQNFTFERSPVDKKRL